MNEEIEIQVKLKNPKQAEAEIREKANFVDQIKQKDQYFVPFHNDFFTSNPIKKYLRIRNEKDKSVIGYHFCHFNQADELVKTDEYETEVEEPEKLVKIFTSLNFEKKVTVVKERKCYETDNFELMLDKVKGLGYFLEIEVKKVEDSPQEEVKNCFKLLERLNISYQDTPNKGYCEMVLDKKQDEE